MNHNYQFLNQVKQLVESYQKQRELSGENFNIFSIMTMESDEVFTHSALISELLNPKGSHSLGTKPLELFYKMVIEEEKSSEDLEQFSCRKEEHIGFISKDQTEGGRLDIVVKDANENGFVIENKIYAGEQINQLMRYRNRYKDAKILYLTLEGDESKQLKSDDGIEYYPISYEIHIVNWITECSKLAYDKPILRETLKQYLNLIKKLTNQTTDIEMSKEIVAIINDNFVASAEIFKNFETVLRKKQLEFLESIKAEIISQQTILELSDFRIELTKDIEKDFIEITLEKGFCIYFRFKNNNPIILVGIKSANPVEHINKLHSIFQDAKLGLRKVDWSTEEWFYWRYQWKGLGNPSQLIEALKTSAKQTEIANYLNSIIQEIQKPKVDA